jgi:hypothetical protein
MALTTIAELRSALGIGTLYSDAILQEIVDATDDVLIPMLWTPNQFAVAHSNVPSIGTLYFDVPVADIFYVGESVTISNCGTKYAGTKTITAVGAYSISMATTHTNTVQYHPIEPYGTVAPESYTDWTTDAAVQQAALQISINIFQARQTTSSGGVAVDFQPGPWKMSSSLLAQIRGLISHALDPRSLIG